MRKGMVLGGFTGEFFALLLIGLLLMTAFILVPPAERGATATYRDATAQTTSYVSVAAAVTYAATHMKDTDRSLLSEAVDETREPFKQAVLPLLRDQFTYLVGPELCLNLKISTGVCGLHPCRGDCDGKGKVIHVSDGEQLVSLRLFGGQHE